MSVYTTVTAGDLNQFLLQYDIGELLNFSGITAGVENTNYFVNTTKGQFVLTLYEAYSKQELPYFLDLMQHLSEQGVKTLTPVANRKKSLLGQLCGKPAVFIERLSGTALKQSDITVRHCEIIGDALARFHLAGASFHQKRDNARAEDFAPALTAQLSSLLSKADHIIFSHELAFQKRIDWSTLPSGVTHSDLFSDNSIFATNDDSPVLSGIIDLYFACNDAFIYDLAVVASDWCNNESGSLDETRYLALLSAYHKVRRLSTIEKQAWVAMLRTSALRFWILRLKLKLAAKEGDMVLQKDPNELKVKLLSYIRDQNAIMHAIKTL